MKEFLNLLVHARTVGYFIVMYGALNRLSCHRYLMPNVLCAVDSCSVISVVGN